MKKKLIFTLISFWMLSNVQGTGCQQSTHTLRRLNPSSYPILNEVVQDAIKKLSSDSTSLNLFFLINEYKGGSLVKAVKTNVYTLEERDNWEGYFETNGKIVFVDFGVSKYRPVYVCPSDSLVVNLERFENNFHISDITYYYILDDAYAIYSPDKGWSWSDGKKDE